jgi:hypothetical protein
MTLRRKSKGILGRFRHSLRIRRHHVKRHLHKSMDLSASSFRDINVAQWGF